MTFGSLMHASKYGYAYERGDADSRPVYYRCQTVSGKKERMHCFVASMWEGTISLRLYFRC